MIKKIHEKLSPVLKDMEEQRVGSINEYRAPKVNKGAAKELFAIKTAKTTPLAPGGSFQPATGANKSESAAVAAPNPATTAQAFDGNKGLKAGELGPAITAASSSSSSSTTTVERRESHLTAGAAAKAVLATVMLVDGMPFKVPHPPPLQSF